MSLTEIRPETPATQRPHRPRPRLASRLSGGHWLMLLGGLLAAVLNLSLLRSADDTVAVAALARDLHAGEVLGAGDLRAVRLDGDDEVLAGLIPFTEASSLVGHVASGPLAEGQLVSRGALSEPADRDGLRTMSVPIDPAHAVGGELTAGDRVDVVHRAGGGPTYLAGDLEVVGVADRSATGLGAVGTYHVTLALDAETALLLADAIEDGGVHLVRSTGAVALPSDVDGAR